MAPKKEANNQTPTMKTKQAPAEPGSQKPNEKEDNWVVFRRGAKVPAIHKSMPLISLDILAPLSIVLFLRKS